MKVNIKGIICNSNTELVEYMLQKVICKFK